MIVHLTKAQWRDVYKHAGQPEREQILAAMNGQADDDLVSIYLEHGAELIDALPAALAVECREWERIWEEMCEWLHCT